MPAARHAPASAAPVTVRTLQRRALRQARSMRALPAPERRALDARAANRSGIRLPHLLGAMAGHAASVDVAQLRFLDTAPLDRIRAALVKRAA